MSDHNRKTIRSFQCRDHLWDTFSQMSGDLECSVDYLINEAMRQYARSRNYSGPPGPGSMPAPAAVPRSIPSSGGYPGSPRIPGPPGASMRPTGIPGGPPPPPPPPNPYGGGYGGGPVGGGYAPPSNPPPLPGPPSAQHRSGPPSLGGQAPLGGGPGAGQYGQSATLSLIFNGQKIPITKPVFKIGRGSKTADLPIKDGNVSREHAAIVRRDGAYFIRDLGSVNGIDFGEQKIDEKRIEEGDVIRICDYSLSFTYR